MNKPKVKNETYFIEMVALTDSTAFVTGECVGAYKYDDIWVSKGSDGKLYRIFKKDIENPRCYRIDKQYSMNDLIWYLWEKNSDYQTVYKEILIDAIKTTFLETRIIAVEEIYKYIIENLI